MIKSKVLIFVLAALLGLSSFVFAEKSDFNLSNSSIDLDQVHSGGPPPDGIPALSKPEFVKAQEAENSDEDLIVGLFYNGEARAYPVNILNWHEIINDNVAGLPVAITFCPLTKSSVVFSRKGTEETHEFRVSGLLYNNNMVMYDKSSLSLWPQLRLSGATGKFSGKELEVIPSYFTTWGKWKRLYPDTLMLSRITGYKRNYDLDPYASYHEDQRIIFPMKGVDRRLPAKSLVIGIKIGNTSKAFPIKKINEEGVAIEDEVGGQKIIVNPGPSFTAYITDGKGRLLPSIITYWFAWSAFNDKTLIFSE